MDYADKYGVDYDEDFWLTDGYIIVNFTIETVDPDGRHRLSYINAGNHLNNGNCSMWTMEGRPSKKAAIRGRPFLSMRVILSYTMPTSACRMIMNPVLFIKFWDFRGKFLFRGRNYQVYS